MEVAVVALEAALVPDLEDLLGEGAVVLAVHRCLVVLTSRDEDHRRVELGDDARQSPARGNLGERRVGIDDGFAGHGGQVPDVTGEEDDKKDETWCLFDGQLIDDELYYELSRFGEGVRILVLSDSCHSGTVTREAMMPPATNPSQRPKLMPEAVAMRTYREHKAFYDKLQKDVAAAAGRPVVDPDTALAQVAASGRLSGIVTKFNPAVILVSGCQDNQTSMDGEHNGAFTEQLLRVWNQGGFQGNYANFHARIKARLPATQSPNLFTLGAAGAFLAQKPFSV